MGALDVGKSDWCGDSLGIAPWGWEALSSSERYLAQRPRHKSHTQVRGNCWYFTCVWVVMSEFDIFVLSPNDGVTRATDSRFVGKRASVCGYGKDCASALNGSGGRMLFAECNPLCALQACYEAVQVESVMSEIDIFVSPTGIITLDHMKKLMHNTFVGNTGHFDNEVDLAGSEGLDIKLQKFFSPSPLATM